MLPLLLAAPFVVALAVSLLPRSCSRTLVAGLAALAPVVGFAILVLLSGRVMDGEIVRAAIPWIPQLGLELTIRIDGYALMFAGIVLAIGLLIVTYARYYLDPKDSAPRFFAFLLLFMGAMLGMVIVGNLLALVVFWELTSISSFLLIGFWFHRGDAREGAKMALALTGMGGLALLAGVLLIGRVVGSYELDVVLASGDLIRAHPTYPIILGTVLLGIFTKSAQFPFHFWLPHAMAAPTPVSAYLHSATMVKAGVFLLARLHPALAGTELFFYVVTSVGAITMLLGAWHAIFQHDLKGLLAYSTISHLGLITLLFGLSTPMSVVAGLFHILNHATFKASLFMAAGVIDHETGTRDIRKLGGLFRVMPWTAVLAIIAALAMAGVPLLNGFLSKEMFFAEALNVPGVSNVFQVAMTSVAGFFGALSVAYSLRFIHDTFFGDGPRALQHEPHGPPRWMRIPIEVLVVACLAVGVAPALTVAPILDNAVRGVLGAAAPSYSLAVWHGFNLPLAMSLAGIAGGLILYVGLRRWLDLHGIVRHSLGRRAFHAIVEWLVDAAAWITRTLGAGGLRRYLRLMVLSALVLGAAPFVAGGALGLSGGGQPMPALGWVLWTLTVVATVAVVALHRQRLLVLIPIGAVGLCVSIGFIFLSAPDLALTQILVEMVTLVLLLLALNYLPQRTPAPPPRWRRVRDGAVALAAGGGTAALIYAAITRPFDTVAGELLARSLPQGGGTNVVNVILVDFRGFDTLGEITVFGIGGLLLHALLRRVRIAPDVPLVGPPPRPLIPQLVARLLMPLAVATSIYLFLRGHNLPGGGFIAGLVLAVPLLLQYATSGARFVEQRYGFDYVRAIALGLLAAIATGVGAWLFGRPFLTSAHGHPHLPLIGELPLASALGFDLGVYLVVFGATMLGLSMMGTIPAPHPPPRAREATA